VRSGSIRTIEALGATYVETLDLLEGHPAWLAGERQKRRYRPELAGSKKVHHQDTKDTKTDAERLRASRGVPGKDFRSRSSTLVSLVAWWSNSSAIALGRRALNTNLTSRRASLRRRADRFRDLGPAPELAGDLLGSAQGG
jgi:hypothetical protein